MSGAGVGGTLGGLGATALAAALAPETGGLSLAALGALGGAAGSALGGKLTGDKDIGRDAIAGGIGGAIPGLGEASGITSGLSGMLGNAAANGLVNAAGGALSGGIAGRSVKDALLSGLVSGIAGYAGTPGTGATEGADEVISPALKAADPTLTNSVGTPSSTGGTGSSILGNVGSWVKQNPLQAAILGSTGLAAAQSLMPQKQVDVGANANSVFSTNPNFTNPKLPAYHIQNTYTPYTGDWYTYGMKPESAMVSSQAIPGYNKGGMVRHYSAGGPAMPGIAPAMAGGSAPQQGAVNPLATLNAFKIGHALGRHLRSNGGTFTGHGAVSGAGGGHDDLVPAKLSDGEYVHSADVVAALGDGSTKEGAKKLREFDAHVRSHKTSNGSGFPPKAKNPLSYLPKGGA